MSAPTAAVNAVVWSTGGNAFPFSLPRSDRLCSPETQAVAVAAQGSLLFVSQLSSRPFGKTELAAGIRWDSCVFGKTAVQVLPLQDALCDTFPAGQVTAFRNIESMLDQVHFVAEGSLIYLSESSEMFIRVRNGWRKLQVLLHCFLTPSSFLTQNGAVSRREKWGCQDSFWLSSGAPGDCFLCFSFWVLSAW